MVSIPMSGDEQRGLRFHKLDLMADIDVYLLRLSAHTNYIPLGTRGERPVAHVGQTWSCLLPYQDSRHDV